MTIFLILIDILVKVLENIGWFMPYVPSKKTDGKSEDREIIDIAVEAVAQDAVKRIIDNQSLRRVYKDIFLKTAIRLGHYFSGIKLPGDSRERALAKAIYEVSEKYGYWGAHMGELNYAFTRFIQRVPQIKVEQGEWDKKNEFRYWIYAATVSALIYASRHTEHLEIRVDGVFEDIKDEYKRRVNPAYEAEQILKSGDCYDTPYYTRLVEVVDEDGKLVGHQEIMLKRSEVTLKKDLLDGCFVLQRKPTKTSQKR